jgi:hypothetical protein
MKKVLIILIFTALIIFGYFAGGYIFREKKGVTIKDIVTNTEKYLDEPPCLKRQGIL